MTCGDGLKGNTHVGDTGTLEKLRTAIWIHELSLDVHIVLPDPGNDEPCLDHAGAFFLARVLVVAPHDSGRSMRLGSASIACA